MEMKKLQVELELTDEDADRISALIASMSGQLHAQHAIPRDVALCIAIEQLILMLRNIQEDTAKDNGVHIIKAEDL